ncbi:hypothetical protein MJ1HA_1119 [Metallosphaera sedula]|nr:hypothetical protein MJ1HA_1119 [Metallosphaera sedula]
MKKGDLLVTKGEFSLGTGKLTESPLVLEGRKIVEGRNSPIPETGLLEMQRE